MRVLDMGVQKVYDNSFEVKRELWDRDYLFLYFHTSCYIEFENEVVEVKPPAVILYKIGSRQHYYAKEEVYSDDYVHFLFDDSRSFVDRLNIPMNTVIPLPENTEVPALLKMMYQEYVSMNEFKDSSMEHYFKLALIKVSELSERVREAIIPSRYDEMFRTIRSAIFLNPEKEWSVVTCAEENGLSTPYFQKLYKNFFGTTFVQDVVKSRMEQAKHFLIISGYSIGEIADLCGYHSETFFMKQFKKNVGMTPTEYRKYKNTQEI